MHVDIVGPFPESAGNRYLLTMIDRTTRWTEVCPLPDIRADTTTAAFVSTWISRYGVPATVTSDRGAQFTSEVWVKSLKRLGIDAALTSAYHPQANGMIERFHRTLKNSLRCTTKDGNWMRALPWALLGIRNAPREDTGTSPAETVFGTTLRLPGMCFPSNQQTSPMEDLAHARYNVDQFTPRALDASKFKAQPFIPTDIRTADYVYVRVDTLAKGPLSPQYTGPYRVISKNWEGSTFTLDMGRTNKSVSIDRLKPARTIA